MKMNIDIYNEWNHLEYNSWWFMMRTEAKYKVNIILCHIRNHKQRLFESFHSKWTLFLCVKLRCKRFLATFTFQLFHHLMLLAGNPLPSFRESNQKIEQHFWRAFDFLCNTLRNHFVSCWFACRCSICCCISITLWFNHLHECYAYESNCNRMSKKKKSIFWWSFCTRWWSKWSGPPKSSNYPVCRMPAANGKCMFLCERLSMSCIRIAFQRW